MADDLKIYAYAGCSTCQKALAFVRGRGVAVQVVDITTSPPTLAELQAMLLRYDGQLKKLFNTSGQVYREQRIGERLAALSTQEALGLLAANGRLVKRPFLVRGKTALIVGFKEEEWRGLL